MLQNVIEVAKSTFPDPMALAALNAKNTKQL